MYMPISSPNLDADRLKDEAGLWDAVKNSSDSAARVAVEKVFANAKGTDPNTRNEVTSSPHPLIPFLIFYPSLHLFLKEL